MHSLIKHLVRLVSSLTSIYQHQSYTRIRNSPEYQTYLIECASWDAPASIKEFKNLQRWRTQNKTKPKPHITPEFIRTISDKFDSAHPYLVGHYVVLTIIRFEWAASSGIITQDQLEAFKQYWRSPAR